MRSMSRWLGIAGLVLLSIPLGSQVGADQVTLTGILSHDALSDPDLLGLHGASIVFVSGASPNAVPSSSGTQGGTNAFDYAFYDTIGSLTVTGSAGGAVDGRYVAGGTAGFRSPIDPGFDWIEITGHPSALVPNARVNVQVYFANNAVLPDDPLGFIAFGNAQATVAGDLVISDGNPHGGSSIAYDMNSLAVIGTLPEPDASALGIASLLALAALWRRR